MKYITIIILALSLSVCSTAKTVKQAPFTVRLDSPKVSIGTVEAQFNKTVSIMGLRQVEVSVHYYPLEDAVCLQYRIDLMSYYLFLSREGRDAYKKALEQYKEEYVNRDLKTSGNRNTRRKYGKAECYLIWQAAAFTIRASANTDVEIGYDIKKVSEQRASFFTLYQREAIFVSELDRHERRNTTNIPIYFTRANADELSALFDQDFLNSIVPDDIKKRGDSINPDVY